LVSISGETPHPQPLSQPPLIPPYKRGEDSGCFAFFARERGARKVFQQIAGK